MCTCTCIHSFLASDVSTWQCRERGDNKSAPADLRFRLASFIHSVNSPRANFKIQIQIQIQGIASFIHSVNSPRKSQDSNNQLIHIIPLLAAITSLHFSQFWSLRLSDSKRLLPESPAFFYWWFLSLSQKFSLLFNCSLKCVKEQLHKHDYPTISWRWGKRRKSYHSVLSVPPWIVHPNVIPRYMENR